MKKHNYEHFLCWISQTFSMIRFLSQGSLCLQLSALCSPTSDSFLMTLPLPETCPHRPLPIKTLFIITVRVGYSWQRKTIMIAPSSDSPGICIDQVLLLGASYFACSYYELVISPSTAFHIPWEQGLGYLYFVPSCMEPDNVAGSWYFLWCSN